jgi:TRAP-type mannitol/chloroaromatic compound transport system permease small subunit
MKITKMIEKLSLIGGVISGISILLMTGLILLEILLRSTTGISTLICEEYSAYLLVVFVAMALAYTFRSGCHIRVDLILSKLSPRARLAVDLCCTIISSFVFVYVVFQSWVYFYGSFSSGQTSMYFSKTPIWIPQIFIVLGTGLMTLQLFSRLATLFRDLGAGVGSNGVEVKRSSKDPK